MSEDGVHADIDVDYRSSRSPQALFNGHLTASNSDIRAGENPKVHNGRWQGLVTWWQGAFGRLAESAPKSSDLLNIERPEVAPHRFPPTARPGAAPDHVKTQPRSSSPTGWCAGSTTRPWSSSRRKPTPA